MTDLERRIADYLHGRQIPINTGHSLLRTGATLNGFGAVTDELPVEGALAQLFVRPEPHAERVCYVSAADVTAGHWDQVTTFNPLAEDASFRPGFAWPISDNADDRAKPATPPGWFIATRWDEEYSYTLTDGSVRHAVHTGLDLNLIGGAALNLGHPVFASADGEVVTADSFPTWGNVVLLRHEWAQPVLWTQYAHLQEMNVSAGQPIVQGDIIGTIGRGEHDVFSPHLHFEIRRHKLQAEHWPGMNHGQVRDWYVDPPSLLGH
jgi:murein DD-endopeptidase MepM/ murein hydrolase activator NlpD